MPTDVVMPQLGESIAEGTIVRWIKKVGDQVARDEPLFEISTDKVDAEIPSPAAGVVGEIRVQEGETVPVNSVVAVIRHEDERRAVPAGPSVRFRGHSWSRVGSRRTAWATGEAFRSPAASIVSPGPAARPDLQRRHCPDSRNRHGRARDQA